MKIKKFRELAGSEYEFITRIIHKIIDKDITTTSFQNYFNHDFDEDYAKLVKKLVKKDIDIADFFDKFREQIYEDERYTSWCGFMDAVLYKFDKDFPLSGGEMATYVEYEFTIKYGYGYQNCDLGIKYLLQAFNTLEDFYKDAAKVLAEEITKDKETFKLTTDIDKKSSIILIPEFNLISDAQLKDIFLKQQKIITIDEVSIIIIADKQVQKELIDKINNSTPDECIVNFAKLREKLDFDISVKKYNL